MDIQTITSKLAEQVALVDIDIPEKEEIRRLIAALKGNISAALSAGYSKSVMQFLQNAKAALNEAESLVKKSGASDREEAAGLNGLFTEVRKSLYSEIKRTGMHIC